MIITCKVNRYFRLRGPFRVFVCLVALVAFFVNIFSYDLALLRPLGFVGQAWASQGPAGLTGVGPESPAARAVLPKEINPDTFTLPAYLGTVQYTSISPNSERRTTNDERRPTIIHVQDAHCNYNAQKKISEIIEYLNTEYGVYTINLEGGAKGYDLTPFTDIKDKDKRLSISDHFVKEGIVNGAEHYAVNNPDKVTLWGIEEPALYINNLKVYLHSIQNRNDIDKYISRLSYILSSLKINIYSKELLEFDTKYNQYKQDNIQFRDYLDYLISTAKNSSIDIRNLNNVYILSQALYAESTIDFKAVNRERDELIDLLNKKLSRLSMEDLVVKTVEFKSDKISQKDYYTYLLNKAESIGMDISSFEGLKQYLAYISIYDAIDKLKVMDELESLEDTIRDSLAKTDEQKELALLSKNLALLKNLFNISITRKDYEYYLSHIQSFQTKRFLSFIDSHAPKHKVDQSIDSDIHNLDSLRHEMARFYELSFKRDEAFVRNLRFAPSAVQDTQYAVRRTPYESRVSVLITGGFHADNLRELLTQQGISYISILPNFISNDGRVNNYHRLLSANRAPIRQQIDSYIAKSLAIASPLNPLLDTPVSQVLGSKFGIKTSSSISSEAKSANGFVVADQSYPPMIDEEMGIIKASRVDLRKLPAGTIVYYEIAAGRWTYTLRVEKEGRVSIWLRRDRGRIVCQSSIVGSSDIELKTEGILDEKKAAYMPYFHQSSINESPRVLLRAGWEWFVSPPENILLQLPDGALPEEGAMTLISESETVTRRRLLVEQKFKELFDAAKRIAANLLPDTRANGSGLYELLEEWFPRNVRKMAEELGADPDESLKLLDDIISYPDEDNWKKISLRIHESVNQSRDKEVCRVFSDDKSSSVESGAIPQGEALGTQGQTTAIEVSSDTKASTSTEISPSKTPSSDRPAQMGKRTRGEITTDDNGQKNLRARLDDNITDITLAKEDNNLLISALNTLIKENPNHSQILELFLSLLKTSPPELYTYDTIVGDLFGVASNNAVAIYKDLLNDPIALVHEAGEYLIKSGRLQIYPRPNGLAIRAGYNEPIEMSLSSDALRQLDKSTYETRSHYFLRALQREVFGDQDRDLRNKIKKRQEAQRLVSGVVKKVSKHTAVINKEALGKDLSYLIYIFKSIDACIDPNSYGNIATDAIANNIAGITATDVRTWLDACLAKGKLDLAGNIAVETLRNNVSGITVQDVYKLIELLFAKNDLSLAGNIAVEAIKNNLSGITPEDVRNWIDACFEKGDAYQAGLIAIEAIKNNVDGIKIDDVHRSIDECFTKNDLFRASELAIECIDNGISGITVKDVYKLIEIFFAKNDPSLAGNIAVEAIKNNLSGITPEDVRNWIDACFEKGDALQAGLIAIEAIKNNVDGITNDDVRRMVEYGFAKDMPHLAGYIAIEAIKKKIDGIAYEDINRSIDACLAESNVYAAANIVIEALKNDTAVISSEDLCGCVDACFEKNDLYWAWTLAMEVLMNNVSGVKPGYVRRWIDDCFTKDKPFYSGLIAIEALKNNTGGITTEDVYRSIEACIEKNDPRSAGLIAIKALKDTEYRDQLDAIVEIINNQKELARIDNILILSLMSFGLQKNRLDELTDTLSLLLTYPHIIQFAEQLIQMNRDIFLNEVFGSTGVSGLVRYKAMLTESILSDNLHGKFDLNDFRIVCMLRLITKFDTGDFSRDDITFEDIYRQYASDYEDGKIAPLPKGLPGHRVIEVATARRVGIDPTISKYHSLLMESIEKALQVIDRNGPLYAQTLVRLKSAISDRLTVLENDDEGLKKNPKRKAAHDKEAKLLKDIQSYLNKISAEDVFPLANLTEEKILALNKIRNIKPIIRSMLFIAALHGNNSWQRYFKTNTGRAADFEGITEMIKFIDSFIKPHLLDEMDPQARKALTWSVSTKGLREEVDRLSKGRGGYTRRIRIIATRGWIAEYVGYFSDECWTESTNIMRDNPDAIALVFIDEDINDILGGTLLMPNSVNGEKVLIDRGLSPRVEVTSALNTNDFVKKVTDFEEDIARCLGAGKILVPLRGIQNGLGTNNPDIIQYYERTLDSVNAVVLDMPNTFNGHDITNGKCVVLREVRKSSSTEEALSAHMGKRAAVSSDDTPGIESPPELESVCEGININVELLNRLKMRKITPQILKLTLEKNKLPERIIYDEEDLIKVLLDLQLSKETRAASYKYISILLHILLYNAYEGPDQDMYRLFYKYLRSKTENRPWDESFASFRTFGRSVAGPLNDHGNKKTLALIKNLLKSTRSEFVIYVYKPEVEKFDNSAVFVLKSNGELELRVFDKYKEDDTIFYNEEAVEYLRKVGVVGGDSLIVVEKGDSRGALKFGIMPVPSYIVHAHPREKSSRASDNDRTFATDQPSAYFVENILQNTEEQSGDGAKSLIPRIIGAVNRDTYTFMTSPARANDISIDMGIDMKAERILRKHGTHVRARHYAIGSKSNLIDRIIKMLPEFKDALRSDKKARWIIRVPSEEDRIEISKLLENDIGKDMDKVKVIIVNIDDAEHLNTVIDLFVDFGLMELDRYAQGEYDIEKSEGAFRSLKEDVSRLLNMSASNIFADADTVMGLIKRLFDGLEILKIRAISWKSISEWHKAQDALLASA